MIRLKTLKWGNWFSYGNNNELDFTTNKITQVSGANGLGKTSIVLILEEILTSKNHAGYLKTELKNYNAVGDLWATLEFDVGYTQYTLELVRKSNLKLKLLKDDIDITGHTSAQTYSILSDVIGMDYKTLFSLIYQHPKLSLEFLTTTDTKRKEYLLSLFDATLVSDIHSKLKQLTNNLKDELTGLQAVISKSNSQIEAFSKSIEKPVNFSELEVPEVDESLYDKIAEYNEWLKSVELKNAEIKKHKDLAAKYNSRGPKPNPPKPIPEPILPELQPVEAPSAIDKELEELGGVNSEIRNISSIKKQIQGLGSSCPTCYQKIPEESKEALIVRASNKLLMLNDDLDKLTQVKNEFERKMLAYQQYVKDKNRNEKALSDYNKKIVEQEKLYNKELSEWEKLDYVEDLIDRELAEADYLEVDKIKICLTATKAMLENQKEGIENIRKHNEKTRSDKAKYEQTLVTINKLQDEIQKNSEDYEQIKKSFNDLEVLKDAFSSKGLINYKIQAAVATLQNEINDYLIKLYNDEMYILFEVDDTKLNVQIQKGDRSIGIHMLSAGQLARVNVAALLAIRKLLNVFVGNKLNVLFLDEIMGVLDAEGRERLIETLLEEDDDLNIFIIDHTYSHPLIPVLSVIGSEKGSYISW